MVSSSSRQFIKLKLALTMSADELPPTVNNAYKPSNMTDASASHDFNQEVARSVYFNFIFYPFFMAIFLFLN